MTNIGLTPGVFDPESVASQRLAFSPEEYLGRVEKVCELMQQNNIDLLWVTTPDAVCWLHGFLASWYKGNAPMRYPQCYGTAIHAESARSQLKNKELAKERLAELIAQSLIIPKRRRATKPSRAAKQRRIDDKKVQGKKKAMRRRPSEND